MLAALARSQAPAASTCWSVVASALPGVRALAAAATAAGAAAPAAAAPAAAPWQLRFDGIAPGSVLRFDLPHTAADLEVRVGEHEAIELAASLDSLEANCSDHAAHPGAALVTVGQPCITAAGAALQLRARAPSRFLSVEATTGGGSVSVEVVQEGSLRLTTGGGDISVPKVKAYDAHLTSSGGAISGAVTGVDVRVRSGGGGVTLKSLVGKRVEVDSGGGPVALGACYADSLELQSGGGPIHVTNMDCRDGQAALRSGGGPVALDSLNGNCSVESQSGDVAIQLHDNAGAVSVASGGGSIQLFLSPSTAGLLRIRNCARVAAQPGTIQLVETQDDGSLLFRLPLQLGGAAVPEPLAGLGGSGAAGSAGGGTSPPPPPLSRLQRAPPPPGNAVARAERGIGGGADITLDAGGSGTVTLTERGWMDALRHKYR